MNVTGLQIAVLERGWVFIGEASVADGLLTLSKARNIRRWGTTTGLGEIATGGPTKKTVLDDAGTIRAPIANVVALIECDATRWSA
jgi:hypothetical protein